jgi:hypothetical protein
MFARHKLHEIADFVPKFSGRHQSGHVQSGQSHWFRNLMIVAGIALAPEFAPEILAMAPELGIFASEIATVAGTIGEAVGELSATVSELSAEATSFIEETTGIDAGSVVRRMGQIFSVAGGIDTGINIIQHSYYGSQVDSDHIDTLSSGVDDADIPEIQMPNTITTTNRQVHDDHMNDYSHTFVSGYNTPMVHHVLTSYGQMGAHYDGGAQYQKSVHISTPPSF